ncbi:hypothetical protein GLOIN_2v1739631 [Rhizophagus irregularis DAOM 181602=DAOM 197198]|nr:hypothetical protein GLOIN_2v1739631 [Rhizophagus irregularis DAOM 181602=DAOM 197198]
MVSHFFRCLGAWKIWWRPVLGCIESCNLDSQFSGRVDFGRESMIKTSYCRYIVDLHEESEGVAYAKLNSLFNIKQIMELEESQIFPINFIDHVALVHFIHDCKSTCNTKHDEANQGYILNSFYDTAV